jgi:hypothetical protein
MYRIKVRVSGKLSEMLTGNYERVGPLKVTFASSTPSQLRKVDHQSPGAPIHNATLRRDSGATRGGQAPAR